MKPVMSFDDFINETSLYDLLKKDTGPRGRLRGTMARGVCTPDEAFYVDRDLLCRGYQRTSTAVNRGANTMRALMQTDKRYKATTIHYYRNPTTNHSTSIEVSGVHSF